MISKYPVAGVIWQTVQYLLGFERLGFDAYYVEAHSMPPTKLMHEGDLDGSVAAANLIQEIMERFGLKDRWAFHALHSDGQYYGMSAKRLNSLYKSAELLINLHGATVPLPEHVATNKLIYLETDPVAVQVQIHEDRKDTLDYLAPHIAFYSYGENYGRPGCKLPTSTRFPFKPTRQPVVLDLWEPLTEDRADTFTTIGNWRQTNMGKEISFDGQVFQWSKHFEFEKFITLPHRVKQPFELALSFSSCSPGERQTLTDHGWRVRDALSFSNDLDKYRDYIRESRGEFTVAKEQNILLRTGWFSDRAISYLAAGRPVITQETGFSDNFPIGQGLFAFSSMDEIVAALESINSDYKRHRAAALRLAREHFSYDVVLPPILSDLGIPLPLRRVRRVRQESNSPILQSEIENPKPEVSLQPSTPQCETENADLVSRDGEPLLETNLKAGLGALRSIVGEDASVIPAPSAVKLIPGPENSHSLFGIPQFLLLAPLGRLPLRLHPETLEAARQLPIPKLPVASEKDSESRRSTRGPEETSHPHATIIIVTYNGLPYTQLCLSALFADWNPDDQLIIVDNASTDGTPLFLTDLLRENCSVDLILNNSNRGFAAANNQALALATGSALILLNNDTLVTPGWRDGLLRWLDRSEVGLVGPVTNRICNEAQIETHYAAYGEMIEFARTYTQQHAQTSREIRMLAMFCLALRRDVFDKVGLLDERFGIGMFEDEDYSIRVRQAGYQVLCADDIFVHHFSQAAFGELCSSGEFDRLLESNRSRLEEKWQFKWEPHRRRHSPDYLRVRDRIRELIAHLLPPHAIVSIVSKGDDELLERNSSHKGWHFPRLSDGQYPNIYPANAAEAIQQLESSRADGASFFLIPRTGFWWLDHYKDLKTHLDSNYHLLLHELDSCVIYDLSRRSALEPLHSPGSKAFNDFSPQPSTFSLSIIIPVFNHENLTRNCLEVLFHTIPENTEVIVVDDASTDDTTRMLAHFSSRLRVIRHPENRGFAQSCNDGAAVAQGDFLVFLNNDTIPRPGWLDHLTRYAHDHPEAAIIGSKLLFPNHTIQHAGVAICEDLYPRHIYSGFPEDHPAVCQSRRFQVVTAACMLVRRLIFKQAHGFDTAYRNGLEDVDLCLRLGALGHQIHYCADSVLVHLESASPGRSTHNRQNVSLYRERWHHRVQPDDIHYYVNDGLMRLDYESTYPINIELSPELATVHATSRAAELERLLHKRSREIADLVRENARLSTTLRKHAPDTPELQYQAIRNHICVAVQSCVPPGATVAVISKGDNTLLDLPGFEGWHFPRTDRGIYLGYHPANCVEAIEHLEKVRGQGADYLLIPATSIWWLDHYTDFHKYLNENFLPLYNAPEHCFIFHLQQRSLAVPNQTDVPPDARSS